MIACIDIVKSKVKTSEGAISRNLSRDFKRASSAMCVIDA